MVYKRVKQRQDIDYGQQLRQQRVQGSINPFKLGFISVTMAVVLTFLILHHFLMENNIQVNHYDFIHNFQSGIWLFMYAKFVMRVS